MVNWGDRGGMSKDEAFRDIGRIACWTTGIVSLPLFIHVRLNLETFFKAQTYEL